MYFLGIDIASDNPGYSIIKDSKDIVFSKTIKTPKDQKGSEILKCIFQREVLQKILSLKDFSAICVEAPAFSFSNRMVSIGMIHGALLPDVIKTGIPTVYCPPTKWKYALLGKGNADKKEGESFVIDNFRFSSGLDLSKFDNNQADAAMLAHIAYVFKCYIDNSEIYFLPGTEERVREIFTSQKYGSSKKSGILYRKNEFYFNCNLLWE